VSALLSLGLDAARAADPARYAIAGVVPRAALRPATREEAAEALKAASAEKLAAVPWGGGVGLAREPAPPRYDLALDLTSLDRIVEYDPEDLTLTAECGVHIESLRATLAARGQELPLEAPRAARATLGGVLAANASAPRRPRFGAPRDRILGARCVLSDGTLARTGGKVVKNVAGYGLHRLLCGSLGGLAAILEASLKLQPAPEARLALLFGADLTQIADGARWAGFPRLEPAVFTVLGRDAAGALDLAGASGRFTIVLGFEDERRWVEQQAARSEESLGRASARLSGEDAQRLWQSLADLEDRDGGLLSFVTARNTPAALEPLLDHPAAAGLVFHAPAGRLHLPAPGSTAESAPPASGAADLVHALAERGFTLVAARGAGELEPVILPQAAVLALRERIRAALDPASTLAFGSRWASGGG